MCTVRLAADGGDERRGVAAREPPALGVLQREGDVRAVAAAAAALRALAEAAQPGPERPEAALRAVAVALLRGSRRAGELRKAATLRLGRVRGGRAEARSQRAVDRAVCLCLIHSQRCVRNKVAKSAASMSARTAESAREAEFRRS